MKKTIIALGFIFMFSSQVFAQESYDAAFSVTFTSKGGRSDIAESQLIVTHDTISEITRYHNSSLTAESRSLTAREADYIRFIITSDNFRAVEPPAEGYQCKDRNLTVMDIPLNELKIKVYVNGQPTVTTFVFRCGHGMLSNHPRSVDHLLKTTFELKRAKGIQ